MVQYKLPGGTGLPKKKRLVKIGKELFRQIQERGIGVDDFLDSGFIISINNVG